MANISRAWGFRPAKTLMGTSWTALVRGYTAADRTASTTNNYGDLYIGDAVKLVSGKVVVANSGDTILGVVVALGTNTTTFGQAGYYNPNNLGQSYLSLTDSGIVGVCPAENVLFEVQEASDLDLVPGSQADICNSAGTTMAANVAHGSRTTGQSSEMVTTASNNDVMVVEQQTAPDNDITITAAKYLVRFVKTTNALN
jgi:hypothetical protein